MKRWLLASLALSLTFWVSTQAALRLAPIQGLSNPIEFVMIPFTTLALKIWPSVNDHSAPAFYPGRCLLAGFGWATCVALGFKLTRLLKRPVDSGRRGLLAAGVTVPIAGMGLYTTTLLPSNLSLRRYEVKLAGLPPELDGLKLGQLSDTHFGPLVGLPHIRRAIAMLNAEQPDLMLLTGDFVHRTPAAIPEGIAVLTECRARFGSLAVLGNHDHWEGQTRCREEFARHQIPLIDGDRFFLGPDGLARTYSPGRIAICGVDDLWEGWLKPDLALRDVPEECVRLLLSHNPDVAEVIPFRFPELRFDLQLSGHTHGGQVLIPGLGPLATGSSYGTRFLGGLVQGPRWPVVISRGVGMTVFPVRFGVPPEVVLVTLRAA